MGRAIVSLRAGKPSAASTKRLSASDLLGNVNESASNLFGGQAPSSVGVDGSGEFGEELGGDLVVERLVLSGSEDCASERELAQIHSREEMGGHAEATMRI